MSKVNVNIITNKNEDGPVELTQGGTIPSGQQLTVTRDTDITGIMTVGTYSATNVNVSGVVTAASYVGSGENLTSLPSVTSSKIMAYKRILGYDEYRA